MRLFKNKSKFLKYKSSKMTVKSERLMNSCLVSLAHKIFLKLSACIMLRLTSLMRTLELIVLLDSSMKKGNGFPRILQRQSPISRELLIKTTQKDCTKWGNTYKRVR